MEAFKQSFPVILFIFYAVQESPNILRDGHCPIGSIAVGLRPYIVQRRVDTLSRPVDKLL